MKISNAVVLVAIIVSITTLGGIIIPAFAVEQPNHTRTMIEPGLAVGNLTSSWGSNMSNATAPAEYR